MSFTCIDSFSGAGGLSLGLTEAGFDLLYSFDNDSLAVKTQQTNTKYLNHKVEVLDIRELDTSKLMQEVGLKSGELSLFAGGPPCQGFSVQRIGNDDDERNNFVFLFMQKMVELSPRFFLMENVPGINGKRGVFLLETALDFARSNGYYIHKRVLDAQDYNVPQRRKRMIIVGEKQTNSGLKFKFPEPMLAKTTVRDVISHLPEPPLNGKDHKDFVHHRRDRLTALNLERIQYLKPGQGMAYLPERLLAECHKIGADKIGHRNVYGRMHWDDVAPTITARFDSFTRGLFGHPEEDRTVSLREGALLQTFPQDFFFLGNKVDIARQIGNAVPPKLAYAIGKQIIDALK